jgi:hypothetical protein
MEDSMATDQQKPEQNPAQDQKPAAPEQPVSNAQPDNVDGLKDKKPEDLTPEELRLMADTMPGEGPGD